MPLSLLDSQLRDLEPLQPDEAGVTLDIALPPDALLARIT
jgi:gluconokinase